MVLTVFAFVLNMSGSAARTAGSNHVRRDVFSLFPHGGQTVCQHIAPIPRDAARVTVLMGNHGQPRPPVTMTFRAHDGAVVATAAAGSGQQGDVAMPIRRLSAAPAATACLRISTGSTFALRGGPATPGPDSARLDGKPAPGIVAIFYERHGKETWWQLLPVLDKRFGWGKAPFFGTWTLPFVAACALVLWVGALGLAAREFR